MNLKEVGGSAGIRSYWTHYLDNADGLIWVVDSTDKERIQDSKKELQKLLADPKLKGCPLTVFCNKQDINGEKFSVAEVSANLELNKIKDR